MSRELHAFVSDLDGLCRALESLGERVDGRDGLAAVLRTTGDHTSAIQLVYGPPQREMGAMHLIEILPMLIPPTQIDELIRILAVANARLAAPAFQLRKQATGWRVAHSVCVCSDHEGRLSARAVVSWLAEISRVVGAQAPELGALASAPTPSAPRAG